MNNIQALTQQNKLLHFHDREDLSAFDRLNTALWVFNIDDHEFWWGNKSALRFWEVKSLAEFLAKDTSKDSPTVRNRLEEIFENCVQGERIEENWTLYPTGIPKMVSITFSPAIVENNKRVLLLEASPQFQEGLDHRAKRILEAVRNTPLMISTFGMDGQLLAQNPAAASAYLSSVIAPISLENRYRDSEILHDILQHAENQDRFSRDLEVETAAGSRWHTLTAQTGLDPVSGNDVIVMTEEDITERINAQEDLRKLNQELENRVKERTRNLSFARHEAEKANKSKSNFLATMSHELRTPLNAIIGFSDMILSEVYGSVNDKQQTVLNDISQSGQHLLELITELLEASTIDSGKFKLNETKFNLAGNVNYCKTIFDMETRKKDQTLVVENRAHNMTLAGDSRRLTQILVNLLANAVKYTPNGGQITLSVDLDPTGNLIFQVTDTGIGISKEQLENVCNAFTQADISSSWTAGKGVGLGLYIASQLVAAHDGNIKIDSTENVGTTVSVLFPSNRVIPT